MPIIRQKIMPDSVVYTDSFRSYNALDAEFNHYRINHSTDFVLPHGNHINGIEPKGGEAKTSGVTLSVSCERKYNGIPKQYFLVLERM
jgi:transposase